MKGPEDEEINQLCFPDGVLGGGGPIQAASGLPHAASPSGQKGRPVSPMEGPPLHMEHSTSGTFKAPWEPEIRGNMAVRAGISHEP